MKTSWRKLPIFHLSILLLFLLTGCGSSPWRYTPDAPATPAGLTATAGNGQVSLAWSPAANAAAYNVYYATEPGRAVGSGSRISGLKATSAIVTGLANGKTYYFTVTALNSAGESPACGEVSVTPAAPGDFLQSDLEGNWRFNALVTGSAAGWMRGALAIDADGHVTTTSFLDSSGSTAPQVSLFTTLRLLPDGTVTQSDSTGLHGTLSANQYKDILVATASLEGGSFVIAVLQKRVPGIVYTSSDIKGTGKQGAGPLPFVYHQLSGGPEGAWEWGSGQVGQDQGVTYTALNAATPRPLPGGGGKATSLAITWEGLVTETLLAGALPQPSAYLTGAVMSADKMMMVGTATDSAGAPLLRIVQLVHPPSIALTSSVYGQSVVTGTYSEHRLWNGARSGWGYGVLSATAAGYGSYLSYRNSLGGDHATAAPKPVLNPQGGVTDPADPSFHGQLSYYGDIMVTTATDPALGSNLAVMLKR